MIDYLYNIVNSSTCYWAQNINNLATPILTLSAIIVAIFGYKSWKKQRMTVTIQDNVTEIFKRIMKILTFFRNVKKGPTNSDLYKSGFQYNIETNKEEKVSNNIEVLYAYITIQVDRLNQYMADIYEIKPIVELLIGDILENEFNRIESMLSDLIKSYNNFYRKNKDKDRSRIDDITKYIQNNTQNLNDKNIDDIKDNVKKILSPFIKIKAAKVGRKVAEGRRKAAEGKRKAAEGSRNASNDG